MQLFFFASLGSAALGWLMGILSLFLILLILVQRGKGGGLTGALGGPGGQSAFGSKAGDTFTVITVVAASIWAFVCGFAMWSLGSSSAPIADIPAAQQEETGVSVSPSPFDTAPDGESTGPGSLGGFGSQAIEKPSESASGDTPSMELEPAQPSTSTSESEDGAEPTPPAEEATETEAETAETESPESETPSISTEESAGSETESESSETPAETSE